MNAISKVPLSNSGRLKALAAKMLLAPIVCITMLMAVAASSGIAAAQTCVTDCLRVYSIELSDLGGSIRGIVKLTDETGAGAGARGSIVHAVWTRPDGSTFDQYANIGTRLRAQFSLYTGGNPGTYTLTVAGASKLHYTFDPVNSAVLSKSITIGGSINQPPSAIPNADFLSGSAPLAVNFNSSASFDPDGVIVAYNWNFGDGTVSSAPNPSHTYQNVGNYRSTLTVTDDRGAMAAASLSITVTDDVGGCVSDCLSVDKVSMNYKKKPGLIQSLVRIVDETGSGVGDALVHVEWILPDGTSLHQYSRTVNRSSAEFKLSANTAGHYTLNVVQVTKVGYSFDPDSSNVLSGSIDISP